MPGIPLAILVPSLELKLVESIRKKARFLEDARTALGLTRVTVDCRRVEDLPGETGMRGRSRFVTVRACAELAICAEYALPLLARGGLLLALKGPSAPDEARGCRRGVELLGGSLEALDGYRLPGSDTLFHLVVIRKLRETPREYPRKSAQIRRSPLRGASAD